MTIVRFARRRVAGDTAEGRATARTRVHHSAADATRVADRAAKKRRKDRLDSPRERAVAQGDTASLRLLLERSPVPGARAIGIIDVAAKLARR